MPQISTLRIINVCLIVRFKNTDLTHKNAPSCDLTNMQRSHTLNATFAFNQECSKMTQEIFVPLPRDCGNGSSRVGRKFQILTVLYDAVYENDFTKLDEGYRGTVFVAKCIGLKPSAHLRNILAELAYEKVIEFRWGEARNHMTRHEWRLTEKARWTQPYRDCFDAWLSHTEIVTSELAAGWEL